MEITQEAIEARAKEIRNGYQRRWRAKYKEEHGKTYHSEYLRRRAERELREAASKEA